MSPEQLQGKEADARSDLFSFGCMNCSPANELSTEPARPSVIAAILEREPAPLEVARPLDRIVRRSLAKDPDQRFQTARDLKAALSWVLEQPAQGTAPSRSRLGWVLAGVVALALTVSGALLWRATRLVDHPLIRLSVDLGPDAVAGQFTTTAISPDGARLVYPAGSQDGRQMLATRLLDEAKPALLSGTENGTDPFFSPDGKWIGFFVDGKMKKISVQGGGPIVLCNAVYARGASWGEDGNIVAAFSRGALSRGVRRMRNAAAGLQAAVGFPLAADSAWK